MTEDTDSSTQTAALKFAKWAVNLNLDGIPAAASRKAKVAILDTIGVILAGAEEPPTLIARAVVAEDRAARTATNLGGRLATSPEQAGLLNGISGHVLDYDDGSQTAFAHSSTVILPAVLALSEQQHCGGRELLEAYIIGLEVIGKLGIVTGFDHYYTRGWHATSTLGTIASAVASGKVMGLGIEALAHAIAIAVSEASGTKRNFGTMTKSFHAGHAARCGVHAARLASHGFKANLDAIEGKSGFLENYGGSADLLEKAIADLGNPYDHISPGLIQKGYAACWATHRSIDCILDLTRQHGIRPGDVERIEVKVPPQSVVSLTDKRPTTSVMAKFSMQYVLAAALFDGPPTFETFSSKNITREDIAALFDRISVSDNPDLPVFAYPCDEGFVEIAVTLRGGSTVVGRTEHARGSTARPLTEEELLRKFRNCAAKLDSSAIERTIDWVLHLESIADVGQIIAPLAG